MFVLLFIAVFVIKTDSNYKIDLKSPVEFSEGWTYTQSGKPVEEKKIVIKSNETVEIEHAIPDDCKEEFCLGIWNYYFNIKVSVNNEVISDWGNSEKLEFGKEVGPVWQLVEVEDVTSSKKVKLTIYNPGEKASFNLGSVYTGGFDQINFHIFHGNNLSMLMAIIIIILICIMICYVFILNYYKVTEYRTIFIYLIFTAANSVCFILFECSISQYSFSTPSIAFILSFFSYMVMPIYVILLLREYLSVGKKFFTDFLTVYSTVIVVVLFLYAFNIVHITQSNFIIHIFTVALIAASLYWCIKNYRTTNDRLDLWVFAGFAIISIGTIHDLIAFTVYKDTDEVTVFSQGMVIFLILLFCIILRKSLRKLSEIQSMEHYKELAYTDQVTGGNSAAYFDEQLQKRSVENSFFVMINLLQFKLINQIIGRIKSDELLKNLYNAISKCTAQEELICSLGNAKFGLCIKAENVEKVKERCQIILQEIQVFAREEKSSMNLSLEISICEVTEENRNLNQLTDSALMACRNPSAKFIPEINAYIYNNECTQQLLDTKLLEDRLDIALQNEEFRLYLQPKISLDNGVIDGAEVLVRWSHPAKGLICPDEFIPLFEHDSQIEKLDLYTFTQVCRLLRKWLDEGIDPPVVSINISKLAISKDGYFNRYMELVKEYNIPGRYLEFELTESIAYDNIDLLRNIFNQIHSIGARCAMDDFGKSYSNVTALGSLQFDTAKMDKCFFDDGFPSDAKKTNLVAGAIKLLRSLNLNIVAEGIEEEQQVTALRAIGCDCVQGFYFAKPMPVGVFEQFCQFSK